MDRRGFLQSILAAATAPAFIPSAHGVLMPTKTTWIGLDMAAPGRKDAAAVTFLHEVTVKDGNTIRRFISASPKLLIPTFEIGFQTTEGRVLEERLTVLGPPRPSRGQPEIGSIESTGTPLYDKSPMLNLMTQEEQDEWLRTYKRLASERKPGSQR